MSYDTQQQLPRLGKSQPTKTATFPPTFAIAVLVVSLFLVLAVFASGTTRPKIAPKAPKSPTPISGQSTPVSHPTPAPTLTPAIGLNPHSIELTVNANSTGLLAGDSTTVTDIQQQINTQIHQQNIRQLTAGIVMTFGGGADANRDQQIAHQINTILQTMNQQNIVFNSNTVFEDYINLGEPDGTISIKIYVFL